jgi:hypothetical protein
VDGHYRLVYRGQAGRVEILTVFEGHRLPPWEDLSPSYSPNARTEGSRAGSARAEP